MTLEPLLSASPAIILHTTAALFAFGIGAVQLAGPKGTTMHRVLGWTWALAMMAVAISAFWINEMKQFGNYSWIHGLAIFVLVMLPLGLLAARQHRIDAHKNTMISMFIGALLIAGLFTLVPGRLMHDVIFTDGTGQGQVQAAR